MLANHEFYIQTIQDSNDYVKTCIHADLQIQFPITWLNFNFN